MFGIISSIKYTSFTILFLALFIINLYNWQSVFLGLVLMVSFFVYYGAELGKLVARKETNLHRAWIGGLLLLSILMIVGAIAYYIGYINMHLWAVLVIITPPLIRLLGNQRVREHDTLHEKNHHIPTLTIIAVVIGLLLLITAFSLLANVSITDAVRSPWNEIPPEFFLPVLGLSVVIAGLAWRGRERAWQLPLIMTALFLFVGIAALVYPIGFGFDSFIHGATESHIAEHGTITPKPYYYIGQYAAVLLLNQGFFIPIDLLDRVLLPILTAILIPLAWYFGFYHLTENKRAATFSLTSLFLIPLTGFIVTTPQGLANLWTLLIILLSLPLLKKQNEVNYLALVILGLTAMFIHPLAGIPVVIYLALIATGPLAGLSPIPVISKILFIVFALAGSIVLPIAFLVSSRVSGLALGFDWSALSPLNITKAVNWEVFLENRFSSILDFVYLFGFNRTVILIVLSLIGFWVARKKLSPNFYVPLVMALMLAINFLVMTAAVQFSFLIDYEQSNYSDRLVPLMIFFLTPFLGLGFMIFWQHLQNRPLIIKMTSVVIIAALMSTSLYLTYPRDDNYQTSHGFNVAQSDLNAVLSIDSLGGETEYIVLANQSTSAAAVRSFGFKQYYGDTFYYPIPTGGVLYEYFLNMNENPSQATAEAAMNFAGVSELYFVVNDYWWQAPKTIANAKRNAQAWVAIDEGKVHVFHYTYKEEAL